MMMIIIVVGEVLEYNLRLEYFLIVFDLLP